MRGARACRWYAPKPKQTSTRLLPVFCASLALADVGDEGSTLHKGDVAKKLFGICGMKVRQGSPSALRIDFVQVTLGLSLLPRPPVGQCPPFRAFLAPGFARAKIFQ